jgi:putative iron-dependent peroxidase
MTASQAGILAPVPAFARFLTFRLAPGADPRSALSALRAKPLGDGVVVGVGAATAARLGSTPPGLRELGGISSARVAIPSTPAALWCWLRGEADPGALVHRGREIANLVASSFELEHAVDGFKFAGGRDLSGYEDGTENPKGEAAIEAAIVSGAGPHLDGGSFVATQVWEHDLDALAKRAPRERDHMIGRRLEDNAEIADAPESAHVKRTAQESFEPEAFVLRRSMPWSSGAACGLVFVAFGRSLDAFDAQLRRMSGAEDGVVDALFSWTRPTSGVACFCPPLDADGRLDFGAFGVGAG